MLQDERGEGGKEEKRKGGYLIHPNLRRASLVFPRSYSLSLPSFLTPSFAASSPESFNPRVQPLASERADDHVGLTGFGFKGKLIIALGSDVTMGITMIILRSELLPAAPLISQHVQSTRTRQKQS